MLRVFGVDALGFQLNRLKHEQQLRAFVGAQCFFSELGVQMFNVQSTRHIAGSSALRIIQKKKVFVSEEVWTRRTKFPIAKAVLG